MKDANFVLLTGVQGDVNEFEGVYETETELFEAIGKAEDRGEFCLAYALENPHYNTEG